MRSLSFAIVFAILTPTWAPAQTSPADAPVAAEFPACDVQLLTAAQRARGNAAASAALRREPGAVNTLALLLAHARIDEAIQSPASTMSSSSAATRSICSTS